MQSALRRDRDARVTGDYYPLFLDSALARALSDSSMRETPTVRKILRQWNAPWFTADNVYVAHADGSATIYFVVWLSRVGYSPDGTRAALYYRVACGSLCGSRHIVVLRLVNQSWTVEAVHSIGHH
jgi:hypothetical protein